MDSIQKALCLALLVVILGGTACTQQDDTEPPSTTPANSPTSELIPTIPVEIRLQIEQDYEQLRQLHTQISAVWETLLTGANVQCGETFQTISPDRFEEELPMQDELHRATLDLLDAVQLWQQECNNPRERVPDEIINQGSLKTRSAGMALSKIEDFLNQQNDS